PPLLLGTDSPAARRFRLCPARQNSLETSPCRRQAERPTFAPQPLNAQAEFWRNTRPSIALAEHSRRAAMRRARAAPIKTVLPLSCAQLVNLDPARRRLDTDLEMLRLHDFGDGDRPIGDD